MTIPTEWKNKLGLQNVSFLCQCTICRTNKQKTSSIIISFILLVEVFKAFSNKFVKLFWQ